MLACMMGLGLSGKNLRRLCKTLFLKVVFHLRKIYKHLSLVLTSNAAQIKLTLGYFSLLSFLHNIPTTNFAIL